MFDLGTFFLEIIPLLETKPQILHGMLNRYFQTPFLTEAQLFKVIHHFLQYEKGSKQREYLINILKMHQGYVHLPKPIVETIHQQLSEDSYAFDVVFLICNFCQKQLYPIVHGLLKHIQIEDFDDYILFLRIMPTIVEVMDEEGKCYFYSDLTKFLLREDKAWDEICIELAKVINSEATESIKQKFVDGYLEAFQESNSISKIYLELINNKFLTEKGILLLENVQEMKNLDYSRLLEIYLQSDFQSAQLDEIILYQCVLPGMSRIHLDVKKDTVGKKVSFLHSAWQIMVKQVPIMKTRVSECKHQELLSEMLAITTIIKSGEVSQIFIIRDMIHSKVPQIRIFALFSLQFWRWEESNQLAKEFLLKMNIDLSLELLCLTYLKSPSINEMLLHLEDKGIFSEFIKKAYIDTHSFDEIYRNLFNVSMLSDQHVLDYLISNIERFPSLLTQFQNQEDFLSETSTLIKSQWLNMVSSTLVNADSKKFFLENYDLFLKASRNLHLPSGSFSTEELPFLINKLNSEDEFERFFIISCLDGCLNNEARELFISQLSKMKNQTIDNIYQLNTYEYLVITNILENSSTMIKQLCLSFEFSLLEQ